MKRYWNRNSAVGVVTRFLDGESEIRFPADERYFLPFKRSGPLWGPPSLLVNRYLGESGRGVKLTTHLLSSVEIKNEWRVFMT